MKYLKVFTDFNLDIESLSYEEKGRLFEAMLAYAKDQTVLPLPGTNDSTGVLRRSRLTHSRNRMRANAKTSQKHEIRIHAITS